MIHRWLNLYILLIYLTRSVLTLASSNITDALSRLDDGDGVTYNLPTEAEDDLPLPPYFIEVTVAKGIELYGAGVLLFVGLFGNGLSLAVLTRKQMSRMTMSIYLAAVAVCDIFGVIMGQLGRHWIRNVTGTDLTSLSSWYCSIWMTSVNWCTCSSSFLLSGVAAERCIAISAPLKARAYITRRGALIYTVCVCILSLVYTANAFWSFHVVTLPNDVGICTINPSYYFVRHVRVWTDFIFYFAGSAIVIGISNVIIIIRVIIAKLRRDHLTKDKSDHVMSTVAMLVAVCLVYVSLGAPLRIMYFIGVTFPSPYVTTPEGARLTLSWAIGVFCLNANHSVNFLVYIISGRQFRNELLLMFREMCGKQNVLSTKFKFQRAGTESATKSTDASGAQTA